MYNTLTDIRRYVRSINNNLMKLILVVLMFPCIYIYEKARAEKDADAMAQARLTILLNGFAIILISVLDIVELLTPEEEDEELLFSEDELDELEDPEDDGEWDADEDDAEWDEDEEDEDEDDDPGAGEDSTGKEGSKEADLHIVEDNEDET